jgi:hypothetical protein
MALLGQPHIGFSSIALKPCEVVNAAHHVWSPVIRQHRLPVSPQARQQSVQVVFRL